MNLTWQNQWRFDETKQAFHSGCRREQQDDGSRKEPDLYFKVKTHLFLDAAVKTSCYQHISFIITHCESELQTALLEGYPGPRDRYSHVKQRWIPKLSSLNNKSTSRTDFVRCLLLLHLPIPPPQPPLLLLLLHIWVVRSRLSKCLLVSSRLTL